MSGFPRIVAILCLAAALLPPRVSSAQPASQPTSQPAAAAGDELRVFVITMQAGDEIWEKFAHNTIWIHDPAAADPAYTDVVYNYGLFDFDAPHFFTNFAFGDMQYWMAPLDFAATVNFYRGQNRTMWASELNLSPRQKLALRDFLDWNARPENRSYHYDYYRDNCSTRVRDAIDRATGGQLKAQLANKPTNTTYRWHTRRLTRDSLFWYTLLTTAEGRNCDVPLSAWEESFLPMRLMDHLRGVTIKDDAGRDVPLVKSESVLFQSTRPPEPAAPPNWVAQFFLAGALVGGIFVLLARAATRPREGGRGPRGARLAALFILTLYAFAIGFAGCFDLWFVTFTRHWAAYHNQNLFGFSPLLLPLAFLIPLLFRTRPRARRAAVYLAFAAAGLTVLGAITWPVLPQVNFEPMAFILPVNLALAYAVWRIARPPATPATEPAPKSY